MSAMSDLVTLLASGGFPPDKLAQALELAQQHAIEFASQAVEIHLMSGGSRVDTTADRRRAWDREYRKRKRGNPPDTEKSALTSSSLPLSQETPKEVSKKEAPAKNKNRGTRLPDDWQPKPPDLAMAELSLGDAGAVNELAKFRDYWRAKPGAGGLKADWDATWRVWLRSNIPRANRSNGTNFTPRPGSKEDTRERTVNALDQLSRYVDADPDDEEGSGGAPQADVGLLPFAQPSRP